ALQALLVRRLPALHQRDPARAIPLTGPMPRRLREGVAGTTCDALLVFSGSEPSAEAVRRALMGERPSQPARPEVAGPDAVRDCHGAAPRDRAIGPAGGRRVP